MSRLTFGFVLASSLVAGIAHAESQAEIAARLNEEGKQLLFAEKYPEASAKFQDAHGRVPEPKYFFNHCTSLAAEGKFSEALTACNAADKNADDKLKEKIAKLVERIHDEAKKQGKTLEPTGGGGGPGDTPPVTDPNNPNQTPTGPGPTGPSDQPTTPPVVGTGIALFQSAPPENKYTWSLGLDLYGGGGRMGRSGSFGKSTGGLRVKADYLLMPNQRVGAQGYFQLTRFGEGQNQTGGNAYSLDVFDLGVAGYKHLCGARARACITPLIGIQLALMSPADQMDTSTGEQVFNYASLGARGEIGLSYALGRRYEHVLGLVVGANAYTRVFSEPSDPLQSAESWGLDKGGISGYLGLGYTYRFNTPFGSAPFVTLE